MGKYSYKRYQNGTLALYFEDSYLGDYPIFMDEFINYMDIHLYLVDMVKL